MFGLWVAGSAVFALAAVGCRADGGGGGVAGQATGLVGVGFSMTGGRASVLSEAPPDGAWEGDESTSKPARGMLRDLDAAMSHTMKVCELGLVEQVDEPDPPSARASGARVYRLITMRDVPVWVRVSWNGLQDADHTGELLAKRTEQPMELRVRAGGGRDVSLERRVAEALSGRMRELIRREKEQR